jgi:hypothetical protein
MVSCSKGEAAMAAQHALSGKSIGRLYGANVIDEWTADVSREAGEPAAQIYWNVSTGNPYQVILVKTSFDCERAGRRSRRPAMKDEHAAVPATAPRLR